MCALEAEDGFVLASGGGRIFYRVSGKGPFALVMPANWGVDSYVYARGLSPLEFWLALVTFDPRGVGRSDPVRAMEEYGRDVTARDAASVASALHIERSVVIGHSNGGAVALSYALAFPERVSHLILVSTGARWDGPGHETVPAPHPSTEEEMRRQLGASISLAVHEPSKFARSMDALLPRMRFSPERLRWTSEFEYGAYDLRGRLKEIRAAVLLIHGKDDRVVSLARAEELHRGIAGSRLSVLDSCGHWPFVERRAEFVEAITAFLGLETGPARRRT
jgi:proline iminopeptidase